MEAKHTPGPWFVKTDQINGFSQFQIANQNGLAVAGVNALEAIYSGYGHEKDRISRVSEGQPTAWANARLICAAPDLLAALKELAEASDLDGCDLPVHEHEAILWDARQRALKAIAKATL